MELTFNIDMDFVIKIAIAGFGIFLMYKFLDSVIYERFFQGRINSVKEFALLSVIVLPIIMLFVLTIVKAYQVLGLGGN